jgi:acyl carrier protein
MEKEDLISKLKTIVKPYTQNEEALDNLSEDTDFIKDLEINSANLIDVILDVEQEFNIEIDDESIGKMITVKAAMDTINTKINQKSCLH